MNLQEKLVSLFNDEVIRIAEARMNFTKYTTSDSNSSDKYEIFTAEYSDKLKMNSAEFELNMIKTFTKKVASESKRISEVYQVWYDFVDDFNTKLISVKTLENIKNEFMSF